MSEKTRYKIVIVGDAQVGKTSIKNSYLGLDYVDNYAMTLGVDTATKIFGKNIVHLFDIGGQSSFSMGEFFYNTHGALLVFDVSNRKSFDNIDKWINVISNNVGHMVPAVLVGNKSDLREEFRDKVTIEEATVLSHELTLRTIYEIPYFETSAKTGMNIDHLFDFLVATMRSLYG